MQSARRNADLNSIHNCHFIPGDATDIFGNIAHFPADETVLIIDPPRLVVVVVVVVVGTDNRMTFITPPPPTTTTTTTTIGKGVMWTFFSSFSVMGPQEWFMSHAILLHR